MTAGTLYSIDPLCPFTHRVQICADEIAMDIDIVYGDDIPAAVRKMNDGGNWPVFQPADNPGLIRDSSNIVKFLIGNGRGTAGNYRCGDDFLDQLDQLVFCVSRIIRSGDPGIQKNCRKNLDEILHIIKNRLESSDGPFINGKEFGQAEGHVTPFLYRLPFMSEFRGYVPEILKKDGAVSRWIDSCVNRDCFRQIAPARHKLRAFYHKKAQYGKPMKIGMIHHAGFRSMFQDLLSRMEIFLHGKDPGQEYLLECRDLCTLLFRIIALHARFENMELYPAVITEIKDRNIIEDAMRQHSHECDEMNHLLREFNQAAEKAPGHRQSTLKHLAEICRSAHQGFLTHLEFEESHILPLMAAKEIPEHLALLTSAYHLCRDERPYLIGTLAAYLTNIEIISLLDSLQQVIPDQSDDWRDIMMSIHASVSADQWYGICRRYEDIIPNSLLTVPVSHRHMTISEITQKLQKEFPIDLLVIPAPHR